VSIIINEDKNEIRRYLLGQLGETDEERLELRLLTEPSFVEEFDTIVDEITDQYVGDELDGEDRKRVEEHFLRSGERQQKAEFARELLGRAATDRGRARAVMADEPGFWDRVRAFWKMQSSFMRTATTIATLVIVAAIGVLVIRPLLKPSTGTYAAITLNLSTSDRATGSEAKTVKLEPDIGGIKIDLALPDTAPPTSNYRVELIDDQERSRNVSIAERTSNSLVLRIPADEITRGSYIIHLYVNPGGAEQRIRGSYYFNVE
jgi:hypothetical protein